MSPDEDFSPTGASSGIKYSESFKAYKEMLTANPNSPVFKKIFSDFNASLFGTVPTTSGDFIAEDGGYASELEKFRAEVLADHVEEVTTDVISSPLLNALPVLPKDHVSISVTSHISTNIGAASSQVSNVVNHGTTPPPTESEAEETSPPSPKAPRPTTKKKGGKPSKKNVVTNSESDTAKDTPSVLPKKSTKRATPAVGPSTRTLRKHG